MGYSEKTDTVLSSTPPSSDSFLLDFLFPSNARTPTVEVTELSLNPPSERLPLIISLTVPPFFVTNVLPSYSISSFPFSSMLTFSLKEILSPIFKMTGTPSLCTCTFLLTNRTTAVFESSAEAADRHMSSSRNIFFISILPNRNICKSRAQNTDRSSNFFA